MSPAPTLRKILFWLGVSLPTAALLVMAWLVHQSNGKFNHSFAWIQQSYHVLDLFEQTQDDLLNAEAGQRSFLMSGDEQYLPPYHAALGAVRADIAQLKGLTAGDAAQQANLTLLEKLVAEELALDPATAFPAGRPPGNAAVAAVNEQGAQKLNRLRALVAKARQDQQQTLIRRQQDAEASVARSQATSLALIAAVALTLILVVAVRFRLERLQRFVTVCAWTGQVKHQGQWLRLDDYLQRQFGLTVSHSLSQEAAETMKKEMAEINRQHPPPAA